MQPVEYRKMYSDSWTKSGYMRVYVRCFSNATSPPPQGREGPSIDRLGQLRVSRQSVLTFENVRTVTFVVAVVYKVQIIANICEMFPSRLPNYFGPLILIIACHVSLSQQKGRMYFSNFTPSIFFIIHSKVNIPLHKCPQAILLTRFSRRDRLSL